MQTEISIPGRTESFFRKREKKTVSFQRGLNSYWPKSALLSDFSCFFTSLPEKLLYHSLFHPSLKPFSRLSQNSFSPITWQTTHLNPRRNKNIETVFLTIILSNASLCQTWMSYRGQAFWKNRYIQLLVLVRLPISELRLAILLFAALHELLRKSRGQ